MVEFLNEVTGAATVDPIHLLTVPQTTNSDILSTLNFQPSFGSLQMTSNEIQSGPINLTNGNLGPVASPRPSMSLAQLSHEYAAYLLLNQSGLDHNAIMAASAALPKPPTNSAPQLGSLTSLLPYANILTLLNNNIALLRHLSSLQNPNVNSMPQTFETTHFPPPSSAATCASSIPPTTGSPQSLSFENNLTVPTVETVNPSPQSISPINVDDPMQNSVSKNKLGRSYNPGRPLAMADRQRILDLYKQGVKISHIARCIGVTHSCVSKLMTRYRRTGSMHPRSAQIPRKSSSGLNSTYSPRSSTSPFSSIFDVSSSYNGSSLSVTDDSSSSSQSNPLQSVVFNSLFLNASSIPTDDSTDVKSSFIHKPLPIKNNNSVYCASS
ncbi:Paired box protein Pax-6 [Aphelenchoides besseyi]|nr:Paired box protein Pax-6 [Aphelenchoides besseyi]